MSSALEVATSSRVAVELPVAGLGSRAMAHLVDLALLGAVAVVAYFGLSFAVSDVVGFAQGLSSEARIAGAIGLFAAVWLYWTVFEVAWHGQTPGKRLLRIRVVSSDGAPVTVTASALRNLLRAIDFAPACYPIGLIAMLVDRKHRRLGDLVAGTLLVRDEEVDLARYATATTASLKVDELELALEYLARFERLEPAAQLRLGEKLARRLGLEPNGDAPTLRAAIQARTEKR